MVTLLLVEQNVDRAMDLVGRAYVIENGRTVLEGTRSSLLGDADTSPASFSGSSERYCGQSRREYAQLSSSQLVTGGNNG